MVDNVTSLTGNGLKDWLIQRVTALFLAVYTLFLAGFICRHPKLGFDQWHALFHCAWFQVASIIAIIALSLHAWIGVWTVTTDYIKCTVLRISVQMLVMAWLLGQFLWVCKIVWGQ